MSVNLTKACVYMLSRFSCVQLWDTMDCMFLRNLYAGQETTVRTRHGTTDLFQIGKGVHQGRILPPCLFNLYVEYIMWNARLDESQAGIKTAGRNINTLRYAGDNHSNGRKWERLHFDFSLSCTGKGNGNPLQCSCLENPRDGGAWWTAVYGVAQSRTWLKRLSSSSPSRKFLLNTEN